MAADDGMVTLVVLLDFSAAFDTVDHNIALSILREQFGFAGAVEEWFRNYLQDRSFAVKVGEITSSTIRLNCSFPQGSTLGPLLYVLYAAELRLVSERHGVSFHGFADDSQLSKSMRVGEIRAAKQAMIDCVMAIKQWSHSHRLKLNASKSEVIWIGTSQQLAHLTEADKQLTLPDGTTITASTSVRNLGVQIDENLRMDGQVALCRHSCLLPHASYQTGATPPGCIVATCTRGSLCPGQDRLLQQSVRRLCADCFAGTSKSPEHSSKASDWYRTTRVCLAAHAGASLASCIVSDTIQIVYADVRRRAWYRAWLPPGSVPSMWGFAAAIGFSRGLHRTIQSSFHDAEVLPFFWPKGLELITT